MEPRKLQATLKSRLPWNYTPLSGILIGAFMFILGILALFSPVLTTFGITLGAAGILLASGVFHLVHAISMAKHRPRWPEVLQALLLFAGGWLTLRYTGEGMIGLTLTICFYLFVSGATRWMTASSLDTSKTRIWLKASSIAAFMLGVYMISTLPYSAIWIPGLVLGVNLVIGGSALAAVGLMDHPTKSQSDAHVARDAAA